MGDFVIFSSFFRSSRLEGFLYSVTPQGDLKSGFRIQLARSRPSVGHGVKTFDTNISVLKLQGSFLLNLAVVLWQHPLMVAHLQNKEQLPVFENITLFFFIPRINFSLEGKSAKASRKYFGEMKIIQYGIDLQKSPAEVYYFEIMLGKTDWGSGGNQFGSS